MWVQFEHEAHTYRLNLDQGLDLTIGINKSGNVGCYYLDPPAFTYYDSPEFTGSLEKGGSVNCEKISLYAHASGTHTECALHVVPVDFDMRHTEIPVLQMSRLVSVIPEKRDGDEVITRESMAHLRNPEACPALIVRTLPNTLEKLRKDYSGTNPVYFDPEVLAMLRNMGFRHLLTDLPSIDRESDEGRLAAHKLWFLDHGVAARNVTVTELIYVDDRIADGLYVLNMQVPKIETDAVPSRILIFPCV
jgi:arylformamidase